MVESDVQNERALIGSVVLDAEKVMPICLNARVSAEWFANGECKGTWIAARQLWDEGKHQWADCLTLCDAWLRVKKPDGVAPDMGWLAKVIDDTPTAAHVEYYLQTVRNQWIARRGRKMARDFMERLPAGPAVALQEFQRGAVELLDEASGGDGESVAQVCDRIMARFEEAHRIRMIEKRMDYCPGLSMPWRYMTLTYQGLMPGLHIVGARPSVGKTAWVLNMLRYWCEQGATVAINSLDMELANMLSRPFSELSRVSLPKASFGTTSGHDMERLREADKMIRAWPLRLTVKRDLESFRSWCVMQKVKHNAAVIVVDFLQLLTFEGCYRMGVDDRVSHISATLKAIALDLGVPVVALSQLNRACEEDGGREPKESDLRGSGALEQDAMTVMLLHQDPQVTRDWRMYPPKSLTPFGANQEAQEYLAKELRPVWAILAKNQNGRRRKFPMVLYPNYFMFMLGDYNADPIIEEKKGGKKEENFAPLFGRVHGDWRKDKIEEALRKSGALVTDYADGE